MTYIDFGVIAIIFISAVLAVRAAFKKSNGKCRGCPKRLECRNNCINCKEEPKNEKWES